MDLNQQRFVDWDGLVYYDSKIKDYIQNRDTIGLKMGGIIEFKDLPDPSFENLNYVYNIVDDFVTNSDFVESGVAYNAGTWVQCANRNDTYYYIIFNDNITETVSGLQSQVETKLSVAPNGTDNLITDENVIALDYMPKEMVSSLVYGGDMYLYSTDSADFGPTEEAVLAGGFLSPDSEEVSNNGGYRIYLDFSINTWGGEPSYSDVIREGFYFKLYSNDFESGYAEEYTWDNIVLNADKPECYVKRVGNHWEEVTNIDEKFISLVTSVNGIKGEATLTGDNIKTSLNSNTTLNEKINSKLEKAPNGSTNLLDENNKINTDYLSDTILGQLKFGGTISYCPIISDDYGGYTAEEACWRIYYSTLFESSVSIGSHEFSGQVPVFDENPPAFDFEYGERSEIPEGFYFIVGDLKDTDQNNLGSQSLTGIDFEVGDWAIVINKKWKKIDNTDAVRTVNGKIGNVVLTGEDISLSKNNNQKLNTIIENKLDKVGAGSYTRLYAVEQNGKQTMVTMRVAAVADALVQRDTKGNINVPVTPASNGQATSKKYVDNKIADVVNSIQDAVDDLDCLKYGGTLSYNTENSHFWKLDPTKTFLSEIDKSISSFYNFYAELVNQETPKVVVTVYDASYGPDGEIEGATEVATFEKIIPDNYYFDVVEIYNYGDEEDIDEVFAGYNLNVGDTIYTHLNSWKHNTHTDAGELAAKIDAIQIPDVSNFVTTQELEDAIASVEKPTVDLTNYYTKEETNSAIETAINGIDIPEVNLDPYATKEQLVEQLATKADDIPFKTDMFVTNPSGQFVTNDNLNGMTVKEILVNLLGLTSSTTPEEPDVPPVDDSIVSTIINNKMPMYAVDNNNNLTAHEFTVMSLTEEQAAAAPEQSGFYQIVKDGNVIESGYQDLQIVNDETYYVIALPKILDYNTSVRLEFYDEDEQIWIDGEKLALVSDASTVNTLCEEAGIDISHIDTDTYTVWVLEDICTGSKLRYIIVEDN